MWLVLGFLSALLLGIYDVSKKVSLQDNAVIPVLLTSILFSSTILLPFLLIPGFNQHCLKEQRCMFRQLISEPIYS